MIAPTISHEYLHEYLALALLLAAAVGMLANVWKIPQTASRDPGDVRAVIYAATLWSACALAENLPIAVPARLFFGDLAWFAIAALPLALCRVLWTVTHGRHRRIPSLVRKAAWTFILLTGAAAFLNPAHLMYREINPSLNNDGPLHYIHGVLYFVIVLILYACLLGTMVVTLWQLRNRSSRQRRIHLGLILAVAAPLACSVAYAAGKLLILSYDPSPFAFLVTAPVMTWLLRRGGLCDPLPVARRALIEVLVDAVVVSDADHYVVASNPAARALPGFPQHPDEKPLSAFAGWADVMDKAINKPGENVEYTTASQPVRFFDVMASRLMDGGNWVGHLLLIRDITSYRSVEVRLRETLTRLTAQLEENIGLQATLRAQAHKDPLTNLYNRRALAGFLPGLLSEAMLHQQSISAVMIDIDHFKSINDRFGHGVGDAALQYFGMSLTAMIRDSDLAFRMGGEEFLVLLPATPMAEAIVMVNHWRDAFRLGFEVCGEQIAITLSAGIATAGPSGTDPTQLINDADAAAYRAKNSGRDQLFVHTAAEAVPAKQAWQV